MRVLSTLQNNYDGTNANISARLPHHCDSRRIRAPGKQVNTLTTRQQLHAALKEESVFKKSLKDFLPQSVTLKICCTDILNLNKSRWSEKLQEESSLKALITI